MLLGCLNGFILESTLKMRAALKLKQKNQKLETSWALYCQGHNSNTRDHGPQSATSTEFVMIPIVFHWCTVSSDQNICIFPIGQLLGCEVFLIFNYALICQGCLKPWVLRFPPTVQLSKQQQDGVGFQLAGPVWSGV